MLNYVATTGRYDLFQGVNLNLNFPSHVGTIRVGDCVVSYGYSSVSTQNTCQLLHPLYPCLARMPSMPWRRQDAQGLGGAL